MTSPRRIDELAREIMGLTVRELVELNRILRDMGGPGFSRGLREPRRPRPPERETARALTKEDAT